MRLRLKKVILQNKRTLSRRRKVYIRKGPRAHHAAFNGGFNRGYNKGYDKGRQEGYQHGKYDGEGNNEWKNGVDGLIDSLVPDYEVLPEFTAEQIIAAGVEHLKPHYMHLLNPDELGNRILHALDTRTPMSIVRLGDGELLTLAQGVVMSIEQVKAEGHFLGYAGIDVPDFEARDQIADAVRKATVVGIPKLRVRNFQPLAFSIFRAHQIDYRNITLTDSLINYYLYQAGYLSKIVDGRRVLIIGNHAEPLANLLRGNGVNVVGAISPVKGVKDVPRVTSETANWEFDIALVAAGISAVLISQRIASELGKVAIDFGHLADSMLKGEAPFK